ncbi:hypothetical protein [Taklimakanibacter lacteus]|uniref:hypothetical protein n=1 Tax=Taklimakanibacter lacteus TaxID=2268456 RepID=UPI000E660483
MATRSEAANKIHKAIVKLLLAYDKAKSSDKTNISKSLTGLYAEHAKITGQPNLLGESYAALTAQFKASAGALNRVKERREQIANALVTADEIFKALSAVLVFL